MYYLHQSIARRIMDDRGIAILAVSQSDPLVDLFAVKADLEQSGMFEDGTFEVQRRELRDTLRRSIEATVKIVTPAIPLFAFHSDLIIVGPDYDVSSIHYGKSLLPTLKPNGVIVHLP